MTARARILAGDLAAAIGLGFQAAPAALATYAGTSLLVGLAPVGAAWFTKVVLDRISASTAWTALMVPVGGLAVAGIVLGVLPAIGQYLQGRLNRRIAVRALDRLFAAASRQSGLGLIESPAFRDRMLMAQQAGRGGPGRLIELGLGLGRSGVTVAGFLATLLYLSPVATLVAVGAAAPAVVAQLRLSRARADLQLRITPWERREHHYAELLVSVQAAKELRLLGLTGLFRTRLVREMTRSNAEQDRLDGRELRIESALAILGSITSGACLLWAVWQASTGSLSIGDVSVFIAALAGIQVNVQVIVAMLAGAYEALLVFREFRSIEASPSDLPVRAEPRAIEALGDGIELDNVWFRYDPDGPWILRGVSFRIDRGRAIALVGLNGAGKSTIIKLLCRFYDPTVGTIRWDGIDLREVDPDRLRARIGAVFQDFMEFDLTVAENIGVGDVDALSDRTRISRAADAADAHEFIEALPQRYDTMLSRTFADEQPDGGAGVLLSGGQWQRVALARAFMRARPDLLILDEPSSGLDPEAEYALHARLRRHREGRTSLLVSHRLAAVRDADGIVVLEGGRVVEHGIHTQLMDSGGTYARLFRLQGAGYADTAVTAAGP